MIWLIILIWTISFLLDPLGGGPGGKAPHEREPLKAFATAARHWRRPSISRRILSSYKIVLKQEKKKKWLDLWEISSQTAVSAWDLAIVCHLKELENFKYDFWNGLETHPAGQSLPWCIHPQGQPWPLQVQPRRPLRTSPKWCRGCKVRRGSHKEIPLAQGKEQRLRFAGAAVKRCPMSKVRETQVRWLGLQKGIRGQTHWNHNHRKLASLITRTTHMSNSVKLSHAVWGQPKRDRSWWRVLTECGLLEKKMKNHLSILALRTSWTALKVMTGYWKRNSPGQ